MGSRGRIAATATVGALLLGGVPAAAADEVGCGEVISSSVTLQHDLECESQIALIVAGEGVTVDLGGNTIRYLGEAASDHDPFTHVGVLVEGVDVTTREVTVRNGRIEGYTASVFAHLATDVRLQRLSVDRILNLFEVRRVTVERSRLRDVHADAAHDVALRGNQVRGSVWLSESNTPEVVRNRFRKGGVMLGGWDGRVVDNHFHRSPAAAITFGRASGGSVAIDNRIHHARVGIEFREFGHDDILVRGNRITNSRSAGILATDTVEPAPSNVHIERNRITRSGFGAASGEPVDGIRIDAPTALGTTLTRNHVRVSAGHAIHAPGVTDGGGNVARHARARPACVGVVCR